MADRYGLRAGRWSGDGAVTRAVFRYLPFTIEQDPSAEPEYEAWCVSGEDEECGAWSGPHSRPGPVEEWQRRHTQATRHRRYRRVFGDYAVLRPPPELVELEEAHRVPGPSLVPLRADGGAADAVEPQVVPMGRVRVSLVRRPGAGEVAQPPCEHRRISDGLGVVRCRDCKRQLYL